MKTHIMPCPYCGAPNNRCLTAITGDGRGIDPAPEEGDLSICKHCGGTLRFNAEGGTDKFTKTHLDEYPPKMLSQLLAAAVIVKRNLAARGFEE